MADCARCGADTAMFLNSVPVCVACYHADRAEREKQVAEGRVEPARAEEPPK